MSIDGRVRDVFIHVSRILYLEGRKEGEHPGQPLLHVMNMLSSSVLDGLKLFIGCELWGNSSEIMLGDVKIADRLSYTEIKLVPNWIQLLCEYRIKHGLPTPSKSSNAIEGDVSRPADPCIGHATEPVG